VKKEKNSRTWENIKSKSKIEIEKKTKYKILNGIFQNEKNIEVEGNYRISDNTEESKMFD